MSRGKRGSFVVRVVQDRHGEVYGVVERVATGAKEAFAGAEAIGQVIVRMLPGDRGARTGSEHLPPTGAEQADPARRPRRGRAQRGAVD